MADVTWVAEVEGRAAESFEEIAAAADHAGDEVEVLDAKLKTIGQAKFDADIAGLQSKIEWVKAQLDDPELSGTKRIKFEADLALFETQLAELRRNGVDAGRDIDLAGRAAGAGWSLLGLAIAATAGAALAVGAAFGGALLVGVLALQGLTGGFGTLTSEAQAFRFELTTLQQTTLQDLAKAAQSGFLPGLTDGLKAITPALESLKGPIHDFGDVMGKGFDFALQVVAALAPAILAFGNQATQAFGQLGQPLAEFVHQFTAVLQQLDDTGTTQQAMSGLIAVIAGLLQLLPPLIDAAVHLSAALGPSLGGSVAVVVGVLKPLLELIAAYPQPIAAAVDAWVAYKVAMLAAAAAQKVFGESALVLDATPIGLIIGAIAALIFIIYELATHWDQVVHGVEEGASAIGNFIVGLGKGIIDFFQAIIDAVMAPFRAIGAAFSGIGSAIGSAVNVPQFAEGGIVTRPTIGLIGEAGPEAIVPLSKAGSVGTGAHGDTYVYNISGVIGPPQSVTAAIRGAQRTTQARGHGFGIQ